MALILGLLRFCLALSVFGVLFAAPLQRDKSNTCRTVCPSNDLQKKGFTRGQSYHFSYETRSEVVVNNVKPEASSILEFTAEVVLTLGETCDLEVVVKDPKVNGTSDHLLQKELSEKRMLATYENGLVYSVCADPEDYPAGLNLKKGILSTIQNVLPSFPTFDEQFTLQELDVLGQCPTIYHALNKQDHYLVHKFKNHKKCKKDFTTADESPVTSWWLRSSSVSPVTESRSECYQMFDKSTKDLKEAGCTDFKSVRAVMSLVTTKQENKLKLIKIERSEVKPMDKVRVTDLHFEIVPKPKTEEVLPAVKKYLTELCQRLEDKIKEDAATHAQHLISYLKSVPKEKIKELLDDIRKREFCQKPERLESLYLDIIAYVDNPGAVEVMVDEVVSEKVTGFRTPLYTLALHLQKKPCIHSVKAVSPLFDSKHSSMFLAAGTLIRKYCRFHSQCLQDEPVKEILQKLSQKLDSSCPSTKEDQDKKAEVLAVLKAIGNIGSVSKQLEKSVWKCIESKEAETFVRVAAAQAYRHVSCSAQPTEEMLKLAVQSSEDTEVRIASYVAAIRCAGYEQAKMLVMHVEKESNTQVRSFILSHLRNLQKSYAPYLLGLRYNLTTLLIPTDYERDLKKYSRDFDLSYYLPTLGLGAGVESSIIYSPDSPFPRQLQTNLTMDLFDSVINVGEFSLRLQDLDAIFKIIFGPGGILDTQSQMSSELIKQLSRSGSEFFKKSGKKWDLTSFNNILSTLSEDRSKHPKIDIFSRIFGKEVMFSSYKPDPADFTSDSMLRALFKFVEELIADISKLNISSARALQLRSDYLVPTAQGIPLQLRALLTAVATLDAESKVTQDTDITSSPALSLAGDVFVGYTFGAKTGVKIKTKALLDAKSKLQLNINKENFEVVFDIPEKVTAFDVKYRAYTMIKMPAQDDQIIDPKQGYPTRSISKCDSMKTLGIEYCVNGTYPDYEKAPMSSLGDIHFQVVIKKDKPDKEFLKLTGKAQSEPQRTLLEIKVEAPGASNPEKMELVIDYRIAADTSSILLFGKGSSWGRSIQVNMKQKETSSGSLRNYVLFFGEERKVSSADQAMQLKLRAGKKDMRQEIHLTTMKTMKKYVDLNIEVDIMKSKNRINILKMEAQLVIPKKFNSTSYIRGSQPSSPEGVKYDIYSLTKYKISEEELLKVTGTYENEGEVAQLNHKCHTKLDVKVLKSEYNFETKFFWTREMKEAFLRLNNVGEKETILLLHAFVQHLSMSSSPNYSTLVEIEMLQFIPNFKIEGSAQKIADKYEVDMVAKKDNEEVLKIKGPIMFDLTHSSFKERSDLTILLVKKKIEMFLKSQLLLSQKQKGFRIDLTYDSAHKFGMEIEVDSEDTQTTSALSLFIPKVVDGKIKMERTLTFIQLVLNGYLQQHTDYSRRVQGSSSVDFERKEVKGKFAYDLDKDPKKKVEFTTKYDHHKEKKYTSVKGDFVLCDKTYKYAAETLLGSYAQDPDNKNSVRVRVIRPSGKEFVFESGCMYTRGKSNYIESHFLVQTEASNVHKMESKYHYDFSEAPALMKLNGETKLESPLSKEIIISIDSEVDIKKMEQKVQGMVEIKGEKFPQPIQTNIEFINEEKQLMAKAKIDLGSSSRMKLDGHTQISRDEHRLIRDASIDLMLDLSQDKSYNIKLVKRMKTLILDLLVNGKKILTLDQKSPEPNLWSAKLETQLRRTEIESKITDESMSLTVYPNRRISEDKYEAEGHLKRSRLGLDVGAWLKSPGIKRDLSIRSKYTLGEIIHGDLMLDIFQDPKDEVRIATSLVKRPGQTYKFDANITVTRQNLNPRINFELDLSERSKRLEILVQRSPIDEPTFLYIMDANKPTEKSWTVYSKLKTPSDKIEMLSELRHREILQCRGKTLNGTITSEKLGSFDFQSAICAPGYIELGAKQVPHNEIYMTKVGMKRPDAIKLAVDLVYNSTDAMTVRNVRSMESTMSLYGEPKYLYKKNILLVGAKLWSPSVVMLDIHYDDSSFQQYMEKFVKPAGEKLKQLYTEVLKKVPQEFKEKILPNLPEVAVGLVEEIQQFKIKLSEELSAIMAELGITYENIRHLEEVIIRYVEHVQEKFWIFCSEVDAALEKIFKINTEDIIRFINRLEQKIQEGMITVFENIRELINHLFDDPNSLLEHPSIKWISKTALGKSIWEWIKEKVEHMKHRIEHDWKVIDHYFHHYIEVIKDDMKHLYHKIMNFSFVKKFVKWIESWFHDPDDITELSKSTILGSLVSKLCSFYITPSYGLVRIQVPLKSPVSSLSAAVTNIGLSMPSRQSLRISEPINTIIQSSDSSAKLEKGTLITFDGLVIPIIFSECELLLAKVFDDKLMAKIPDEKTIELKIQLKSGQIVQIHLERGIAPKSSLFESDAVKLPGIVLRKVSESKWEIGLKDLMITVEEDKLEVWAKPWAFSKLEGLMGNHDNEKGNDAHQGAESVYTPFSHEGKHQLTRKAAWELLQIHRTYKTCKIPQ